jgi:tRNA A-37 threonylcarbamoyl transferase component Bud32
MGCKIFYNDEVINPKKEIVPIYDDNLDIQVEKRYYSSTNQIGLTGPEQYLFEKKCLTLLEQNYEDLYNVNFYPFPRIIKDDPTEPKLWLNFCGNTIKNMYHSTLLQQSHSEYNNLLDNINDQIKNILYNLKKNNIYHLDVKQSNVCVNKAGYISLIDFGIGFIDSAESVEYVYLNQKRKRDRQHWFDDKLVTDFNVIVSHLKRPVITAVMPCYGRPNGARRQILNICKQNINSWEAFIVGDYCELFEKEVLTNVEVNKNLNRARRRGNIIHSSKQWGESVLPIPHFFNRSKRSGPYGYKEYPILGKPGKWGTGIINFARKYAIGEYFIWLSDDDIITKNHFENYLSYIKDTDYDMIIFDDYVGEERKRRGCRKSKTYIRSKGQKKNENDGILPGSVGHSNVIVRTDFLKTRPETTRERKHHDFYMVSDIINSGGKYKIVHDNQCTYWAKYDGRFDDWDGQREGVYLGNR